MENSDTQSLSTGFPLGEEDGDKTTTPKQTTDDKLDPNDASKTVSNTEVPPASTRSASQVDLIPEDKTSRTDDNQEEVGRTGVSFQTTDDSPVNVQGSKEDGLNSGDESNGDKTQGKTGTSLPPSGESKEGNSDESSNVEDAKDADKEQNTTDNTGMPAGDRDENNTDSKVNVVDESNVGSKEGEPESGNEDKTIKQDNVKDGDRSTTKSATRDDKGPKDEDSDSNVKDTDPLLSKSDSQKTLQSDTGSSVHSDSSSDTRKTGTQNKKKYSYIPIVATGKDKNSNANDPKRKKSDNVLPNKFDLKRDKDNKSTVKTSRSSLLGSSQNIAMKDKSEPITPSDTKGETTFSVVNEEEKNERNNKNVKWKEGDSVNKDKKPLPTTKKESKIPELDKKKQNLIQKTLQREKAVLSNGSVKSPDKDNVQTNAKDKVQSNVQKTEKTITLDSEKKVPLENPPIVDTMSDPFKPKSILARAIMKKVKEGSGQGQNNVDSKHVVLNGPPAAVKTPNKKSLTVPSPVPRDTSDDKEEKLSIGSRRDSTKLSLSDSMSRKSVDYRVANATTVVIPASGNEEEKPKSLVSNDSWIRSAIPYLPLSMAIFCLFLNIFVPGSGTVLSGLAILCCGKARVQTKDDHVPITLCVNVWVGVAQLFTVTFMLVGWFWSMAWGIKMVILSIEYRKELKQKREKELQALALSAFGSPAHGGRGLFG